MKVGGVYPSEEYLTKNALKKANSLLNFNYVTGDLSLESMVSETEKQLVLLKKNDSYEDKEKIVDYIEFNIESYVSNTVKAKNTTVTLTNATLSKISNDIIESSKAFDDLVSKYSIKLSRPIEKTLKVFVPNVSANKSVAIELTNEVLYTNADKIKVILGNENFAVEVKTEQLKKIIGNSGKLHIKIEPKKSSYLISFNLNGKKVDKLDGRIGFTLPSKNVYDSVYYMNEDKKVSVGGQYVKIKDGIDFSAFCAGEYLIVNNNKTISDADTLSVNEKDMVKYLVSKDIMELSGNGFNPTERFTRYELAKAIVNILHLHDYDSEVDFIDDDKSNNY